MRDRLAERPAALAVALYSATSAATFVVAYFALFSQFGVHDDEGTLLASLEALLRGETLYADIFSTYGPFYYEVFGGFFEVTGWGVTTEASRLIVAAIWVSTSCLYGIAVQRLTGRLLLGVSAMLAAFATLTALISEPMHPHGLAILLLATLTLLLVLEPSRRLPAAGLACGGLVAALLLTKVNLGGFALAAAGLGAVLAFEPLHRRAWIRWPVILAFLALPTAIMSADLSQGWVRDFILLETLASIAVIAASWPARPRTPEDDASLRIWLTAAVVGLAGTALGVLAIMLALGTSLADGYRGVVGDALELPGVYTHPFGLPPAAIDWGVAAVAGAVLAGWLHSRPPGPPSPWGGVFRIVAGLAIWFTIAHAAPFSLNPSGGQTGLPLALAWVAAIPPRGKRESPYRRYVRAFLPALAVAEVLQVYPVSGSQQAIAAVTFVPVGALCIADGLRSLQAWSEARGRDAMTQFGAIAAILIVALAGKLAIDVFRPAVTRAQGYFNQERLSLPGAEHLRIPAEQADAYERLVALVRENRCSALATYPGLNSLNIWSGVPAPRPQLPGPWMLFLDDERQGVAVEQLREASRPCAIWNDGIAEVWLKGRSVAEAPLVRHLSQRFEPLEEVEGYRFLVPRGGG
jgi:hypothetical protein